MGNDELNRLLRLQRRIMELSNRYYEGKPVINKQHMDSVNEVLRFAEVFFPDRVIMIYGGQSERIYFSSNVGAAMSYTQADLLNMPDFEFLSQIHPNDVSQVSECMTLVLDAYSHPSYDHTNTRYSFNMRFRKGNGDYAHILYQAVTIHYRERFADIALIKDITGETNFTGVELLIEKKTGNQFVTIRRHKCTDEQQLTAREKILIDLIKEGFTNAQIAGRLGITQSTVKNHKQNIFRKLNVKTSLQLMRFLKRDDSFNNRRQNGIDPFVP